MLMLVMIVMLMSMLMVMLNNDDVGGVVGDDVFLGGRHRRYGAHPAGNPPRGRHLRSGRGVGKGESSHRPPGSEDQGGGTVDPSTGAFNSSCLLAFTSVGAFEAPFLRCTTAVRAFYVSLLSSFKVQVR